MEDELVIAVENWNDGKTVLEIVLAVEEWAKWSGNSLFTISKKNLDHSTLGDFNSNGRLINGGHGQANIDYLNKNQIEYNM